MGKGGREGGRDGWRNTELLRLVEMRGGGEGREREKRREEYMEGRGAVMGCGGAMSEKMGEEEMGMQNT